MNKAIEKSCELSKKILDQVNTYCGQYTGIDGKDVISEYSINDLQEIIEEGFALHNYIVENKLYEGKPAILSNLLQLEDYMKRLSINKENAEKLRLSNAIQVWNQTKIAIAVLAGSILDEYEGKKE